MHRLLSSVPLALGLVAGGSLHVRDELWRADVERVKVRWGAGDVRIQVGAGERVEVRSIAWGPEASRAFSAETDAEILELALSCRLPVPCGGDLDLTVPVGTQLELELGEGSVAIDGPVGSVSVFVGRGRIVAEDLVAPKAVLQVVDGDIAADWRSAPERVVLATVDGTARVVLPEAGYRIDDRLGRADLIGIEPDPAAARSLEFTTVDGRARISIRSDEIAALRGSAAAFAARRVGP